MIASLPMYDLPGLEAANDRYWAEIAARLPGAPKKLDREAGVWAAWMHPDLLFSQTCGLPFRARLTGKVTYIGTPDYGIPGCAPGWYTSAIIAREGEVPALDEGRFAYNDPMSQSGWNAPTVLAKSRGLTLNATLATGAHLESVYAVAEGRADLAAIDIVSWRAFSAQGLVADHVIKIEETIPTPGLPYIAGPGVDAAPIQQAVRDAIQALAPADADLLQLKGLIDIPLADYEALPLPPPPKARA